MNDLRNTIAHILEHRQHLVGANEATTQQYVVLPILRALGWEDANLASMEILPEYDVEDGNVDYALKVGQKSVLFIECKKWNGSLAEKQENQIFKYAFDGGVPIVGLTNGKIWRFYFSWVEGTSVKERIFCETDIVNQEDAISNLEKYLLKSNVASKKAEQNAKIALEEKEKADSSKPSTINPKVDRNNKKTDNELTQTGAIDTLKLITLLGTGVWTAEKVKNSAHQRFRQRYKSKYPKEENAFYNSSANVINLIVKEKWELKLRFRDVEDLFGAGFFLGYKGILKIERPFGIILRGRDSLEVFVRIMDKEAEQLRDQHGCEFCRIYKYKTVDFVYYRVPEDISELLPVLKFAYNKHRKN